MICVFYVLYVFLTPVNFSWIWLGIALCLQFIGFLAIAQHSYNQFMIENNRNYWKGDE